jgi:O-antigen/teichoic acid export membrane protein
MAEPAAPRYARYTPRGRNTLLAQSAAPGRLRRVYLIVMSLGFVVCDQALFAGTSFTFTLLLGRWATQPDLGAFSVAFSVFILLQNVFEGLVVEPFGVFAAGRLSQQFNAYAGRLMMGHIFIAGTMGGIAILIALVLSTLHQPALAGAFLAMGLATPFLLGRILTRQSLYITARIHWSALTGAIYFVSSLTALCVLRKIDFVTPCSAFLTLGFGSLVATAVAVIVFLDPVWHSSVPALSPRRLIADHVAYGGWAIGERLLLWLQANIFFFELPIVADLHANAVYRALSILVMPAYMTISAVACALLPALVRTHDLPAKSSVARLLVPGMIVSALIYCVLLAGFGQRLAHLAFAGHYDADLNRPLVVVAGIGPILFAASAALELQLRARLMIRQVLVARIAATGVLLLIGVVLIAQYRVLGAALALALTWLTTASVHIFLNQRRKKLPGSCATSILSRGLG